MIDLLLCFCWLYFIFVLIFSIVVLRFDALTISPNPIWPILHPRVKLHQNKHLKLRLDFPNRGRETLQLDLPANREKSIAERKALIHFSKKIP